MPDTRPASVPAGAGAHEFVWRALDPAVVPAAGAPLLRAVMLTSLDGTTSVGGRSAPLGTPTDQLVYHGMRARADLVVAGARTALTEGYGPARLMEGFRPLRGDRPDPTVLLVAGRLTAEQVDHCARRGPAGLAIAAAGRPEAGLLERAADAGVTVYPFGDTPVGAALRALAVRLGAVEVAVEGGPRLLGSLVVQDAVDDFVLSSSPAVRVGTEPRGIVTGDAGTTTPVRVHSVFTGPDGGLYTVWSREGRAA